MQKWTKVRTAVRSRLAPSVRHRFDLHQARYRRTREEVGRLWITFDGRELASFDTQSYVRRRAEISDSIVEANRLQPYGDPAIVAEFYAADEHAQDILRRAGEQDDYRALEELEEFLSLPITAAITSSSPLIRGLAMMDKRVGKRRLRGLAMTAEHPLVRALHTLRCQAEGVPLAARAV